MYNSGPYAAYIFLHITCIINTVECSNRSEMGREWGTSRLKQISDIRSLLLRYNKARLYLIYDVTADFSSSQLSLQMLPSLV